MECQCGCDEQVKEGRRFRRGHNAKRECAPLEPPNPSGLCQCGCGEMTPVAASNDRRYGRKKGQPTRFIRGHSSRTHTGDRSSQWKGGRIVTDQGYVKVRVDGAYVYEHRVVMGHLLGRPMLPSEQVHHLNGIRSDNRAENLELWVRSQPSGVRVGDNHCTGCRCEPT